MRFLAMERYRNDSTGKGKAEQRKEMLSDETLWNGSALIRPAKELLRSETHSNGKADQRCALIQSSI